MRRASGDEHVLEHGALRQQTVILEDESDLRVAETREVGRAERERDLAAQRDGAGGRRLERAQEYRSELFPLPDGPMMAAALAGASENAMSERTVSGPRGVGRSLVTRETSNTGYSSGHRRGQRRLPPPRMRYTSSSRSADCAIV